MSTFGNRGGYGWERPEPSEHTPGFVRRIRDAQDFIRQRAAHAEALARFGFAPSLKSEGEGPAIIDLVEHNGVWMTPEDAKERA